MDTSLIVRDEDAPGAVASRPADGRVSARRDGAEWKVLIVDDEPAVQGFVERVLTRQGYRCAKAVNASEAIAAAMNEAPDLTISDIRMPGSDGTWLLAELKQRYPDMAVIMLTAVAEATTAVDCVKAGADDFLVKPINMDELVVSVERALEQVTLRRSTTGATEVDGDPSQTAVSAATSTVPSHDGRSRYLLSAGERPDAAGSHQDGSVQARPDADPSRKERLMAELLLFHELASAGEDSSDVSSSVKRVFASLHNVIDYDVVGLLLVGEQPTFTYQTRVEVEEDFIDELRAHILNVAKLTCGVHVADGVEIASSRHGEAAPESTTRPTKQLLRSMIHVPLTVKDEVVGLVHLSSGRENAFTDTDTKSTERIASFLASGVEASRTRLTDAHSGLGQVFEQMSDGVLTLDEQGAMMLVNQQARTILDVKPGTDSRLDLPGLQQTLGFDPVAVVASEGREARRRVTVNGVSYQIQLTPLRLPDQTLAGVVAVFRKISRKRRSSTQAVVST